SVIQVVGLILGLAGELEAQLLIGALVGGREDDGAVGLAPVEGGQGVEGGLGLGVLVGRRGQGDQDLVAVEPGVVGAQVLDLDGLDGLDGALGDEVDAVSPQVGQGLQGVQKGGGGAAHELGGLAGD